MQKRYPLFPLLAPLLSMALLAGCADHHSAETPLPEVSGRLYLVPLNEQYLKLPSDIRLDVANEQVLTTLKRACATALDSLAPTTPADELNAYRALVAKETYRAEEREQLAELYMYTTYALIRDRQRENQQLEITPDLAYLRKHNLVKYLLPRSYVEKMPTKLLLAGTVQNYYFIGSDLIRSMEDELAGTVGQGGLKVFFEQYDGWPYMLVIDQQLYHQLRPQLVKEFNRKIVGGEEL